MKAKLFLNKVLINQVSVDYQISIMPKEHTQAAITLKLPKSNPWSLQQHNILGQETQQN